MNQLSQWLSQNSHPKTLLLISGGSAAKAFAEAWSQLTPEQQSNFTITLIDERYGEPGHVHSNWKLVQNLGVDLSGGRHFQVLHNGDTMTEVAALWEAKLQTAIKEADRIAGIFGIGTDHHIAGIKPNSPSVAETERLVSCYAWEDYNRITISPVFFDMIDSAILYAAGADKYDAVARLDGDEDYREYPSQLIKRCREYTVYYQP